MSFLDDLSNTLNRGANATSRGARTIRLRAQIGDMNRQRSDLAAQLGASLYEATKDDLAYTQGREALYSGIADCDQRREQLQAEIARLEEEAAAEAAASRTYRCQRCGNDVKEGDSFCSGCGRPVAEIKAEAQAAAEAAAVAAAAADTRAMCPRCGARIEAGDRFCLACGAPLPIEVPVSADPEPPVEDAAASEAPAPDAPKVVE